MAALDTARREPPQTFFLNDPVVRGIVYQIVVGILVVLFFVWIIGNTAANLAAQNKTTGFDFLWKTAGFDISFSLLPWDRTSYYWEAFLVGILNTLLVAAIGIVCATLLGFTIGIARLSSNFIISRLATVYVETIRNIPLLLQLFFWYFAVLKAMPAVKDSIPLPFNSFINQRGIFVPMPLPDDKFIWVVVALVVGIVAAVLVRSWSLKVREATGAFPIPVQRAAYVLNFILTFIVGALLLAVTSLVFPGVGILSTPYGVVAGGLAIAVLSLTRYISIAGAIQIFLLASIVARILISGIFPALPDWLEIVAALASGAAIAWIMHGNFDRRHGIAQQRFPVSISLTLIIGLPALVFFLTGATVAFDPPVLNRFNFKGGFDLPPELVALAWGLSIYTAAFIAETVRGGIQAVSRGQTEAANSLGLKDNDRLRLVIVPQAMRVIVPPLTSQYLNLTKNSSLGAAIGYPELVNVFSGTALNQTGRAIECIALTMLVYLIFSLTTSAIMNWYNARVALVER
jgi:general L-amino acid transport system permease protein